MLTLTKIYAVNTGQPRGKCESTIIIKKERGDECKLWLNRLGSLEKVREFSEPRCDITAYAVGDNTNSGGKRLLLLELA